MPIGLSVAQASPSAVDPSPHRPISLTPAGAALFPPGSGNAGFSILARRDRARPGPGARRCRNVPSIRSPDHGSRSVIPGPPRPAAQRARATRPPRHRSNHRRLRRLRVWLPTTARVRSLQPFRVASTTEGRPRAPASFFQSRSHPRRAQTVVAL